MDVFNSSRYFENGGSSLLTNRLENGTGFLSDVEELFPGQSRMELDGSAAPPNEHVRLRRSLPLPLNFKREGRGTFVVKCHSAGGFTSSRERWWYIAIANCGSGIGLNVTYEFKLKNGPAGDFWHEHFSADEMRK